jgi:prevent-host-death family protein
MYRVKSIGAIASVTDLRSRTDETIELAEDTPGVLIQKNNEPIAVLVSIEQWHEAQEDGESEAH